MSALSPADVSCTGHGYGDSIPRAVGRQVDLAVVHIIEPFPEEHLHAEPLFQDPHVVVAGVKNPLVRRRRLALSDLMDEPWTLPPPDAPYGAVVLDAFHANGLHLPRTVVVSTLPVRSALLATGRFLSMVPRVVLQFPTKNQVLRGLTIELPTTFRPLALVTLKNRTSTPLRSSLLTGRATQRRRWRSESREDLCRLLARFLLKKSET